MEFARMSYEWLFKANEELFDGAEVASEERKVYLECKYHDRTFAPGRHI